MDSPNVFRARSGPLGSRVTFLVEDWFFLVMINGILMKFKREYVFFQYTFAVVIKISWQYVMILKKIFWLLLMCRELGDSGKADQEKHGGRDQCRGGLVLRIEWALDSRLRFNIGQVIQLP